MMENHLGREPRCTTFVPVWLLAGAVVAKLGLIRFDEIVATMWDAEHYALATRDLFERVHYIFSPGFPIAAALIERTGVPYRTALELVYAASAFAVSQTLFRHTGSRMIAAACFTGLLIHPWPIDYFRHFTSEGLLVCICLLWLAATTHYFTATEPRWTRLVPVTATLAIWPLVRIETPLVAATHVAVTVVGFWCSGWWVQRKALVIALAVPLAVMLGAQSTAKWWVSRSTGVHAVSVQTAPGLEALMTALYRIDPGDSSKWAPVTRRSLEAAIGASATLRRFAPKLLDREGLHVKVGEQFTGREGEFGTRLNWHLVASIRGGSFARSNELMLTAAREIEDALDAGHLEGRWSWYPFDPDTGRWLADMPGALWQQLTTFLSVSTWRPLADGTYREADRLLEESRRALFDEVANRRASAARPERIVCSGRVRGDGIQLVALETADGEILAAQAPRQDAAPMAVDIREDGMRRFQLAIEGPLENVYLTTRGSETTRFRRRLADLTNGRVVDEAAGVELFISVYSREAESASPWQNQIKQGLSERYAWIAAFVLFVAIASGGGHGPETNALVKALALLAIVVVALVGRLTFYALLQSNLGWSRPSYVQCWQPMQIPVLALSGFVIGAALRRAGGYSRSP